MKSPTEMHVGFKVACNVHVWAYFEKIPVSGKKKYFLQKMAHGLGRDISCIKFLVVSDLKGIVQMMQKKQTFLIVLDCL